MKNTDYIFPFFWQHGESEEKLREYMKVIHESNLSAVCVESRPHPDFCGPGWWRDMEIILDEAKKRNMRVWILDDSHFPTGYANGKAADAPIEMRRQSIYTWTGKVRGKKQIKVDLQKLGKNIKMPFISKLMSSADAKEEKFDDDRFIGAAVTTADGKLVPAEAAVVGTKVTVRIPAEAKEVHVTYLSRNFGIHRKYINMMDRESCRILIDAVYEPHFEHFRDEFGKTIVGFFSDEPELGNGYCFSNQVRLGNNVDQPWSRELEEMISGRLGEGWQTKLVLLWDNETESAEREWVRYVYMDSVTRLVEKNFSLQIGKWCEEHGVEYIGHLIEDNNQHSRTGSSLGHYFRGLAGQHMAGIDDIGGQVIPLKEDAPAEGMARLTGRDGEFYHYMLGRLGASLAAVDPAKRGRCMCEIFGNYGWSEGPRLEKQLADHFMVRGINRFVPHAFSPKEYPDPDCPPHFYANGHNPQYRAFGYLMKYINRICPLISGGVAVIDTAILYPGDMEWMGEAMLGQKPARVLEEHQIPFHFIPCDVFAEKEKYGTAFTGYGLKVNQNVYKTLLVPKCRFIPRIFSEQVKNLKTGGCRVVFIDALPEKIVGFFEENDIDETIRECETVPLERCYETVRREALLSPENPRIHTYHYSGEQEIWYVLNEDNRRYSGEITLPYIEGCVGYDAWDDRYLPLTSVADAKTGRMRVDICLEGHEGLILTAGKFMKSGKKIRTDYREIHKMEKHCVGNWEISKCRAIEYPTFSNWKKIDKFEDVGKKYKKFSGYIAYRCSIEIKNKCRSILEITDAGEDVEVFINNVSAGIKVQPPFRFDISSLMKEGENKIRIEVATTLERERGGRDCAPIGITGEVILYQL